MPGRWTFGRIVRRILLLLAIVVVVLNWTWGRLPSQPDPPSTAKYAQVGDTRIHYQEQKGAGPAVVMIHGLPGVWANWDQVVPKLAGRHVITIDRPGYGFSTGEYMPFADQVRTIHQFVGQLGLKRPVIAGFSYGGTIALGYANAYPRETRSMVLVDAAAQQPENYALQTVEAYFVRVLETPIIRQVSNALFGQLFKTIAAKGGAKNSFEPSPVNEEFEQQILDYNMQHDDLEAYSQEVLDIEGVLSDVQASLPSIRTPAQIVQGTGDKLVDKSTAKLLNEQLPNSQLTYVDGGHTQPYIHPAVVAAAIKRALR